MADKIIVYRFPEIQYLRTVFTDPNTGDKNVLTVYAGEIGVCHGAGENVGLFPP